MAINLTGAKAQAILTRATALILVLLPFHAFITAWLASNFGNFDAIRVWKEVLLLALVPLALVAVLKNKDLLRRLKDDHLVKLIGLFFILLLLRAAYGLSSNAVSSSAVVYGLIIDARFLLFFLVALIAFQKSSSTKKILRLFYLPAAVVVAFGLIQFILPNDFLSHFGYGSNTLQPFQSVDNKPDLARIQSTLRGPNPLGAYLVMIIGLIVGGIIRFKKWRLHFAAALVVALLVLFGTYSRSAFIGTALAVGLLIYWSLRNRQQKKYFLIVMTLLIALAGSLVFVLRNVDKVQDVVFHTSEKSTSSRSANSLRAEALENGWEDVIKHPLGQGVGSAGPASVRNKNGSVKFAENFFIQIGQEAGIPGLIIFMSILFIIGWRLWLKRQDILARITLATLLGLTAVNMVSHAWSDDTLAYVFFGLVALALTTSLHTSQPTHQRS